MTVYNYRLPDKIERAVKAPLTGGPEFETRIFRSTSGFEERQGERSRAIRKWNINLDLLDPTTAEFLELESLFHVCMGKLHGFLLKAPGANNHQSPNTVTIGGNPYKRHTITDLDGASHTYDIPITRTIPGSISGAYREYFTPVRFDLDQWPFQMETQWLVKGDIPLVEILEGFA